MDHRRPFVPVGIAPDTRTENREHEWIMVNRCTQCRFYCPLYCGCCWFPYCHQCLRFITVEGQGWGFCPQCPNVPRYQFQADPGTIGQFCPQCKRWFRNLDLYFAHRQDCNFQMGVNNPDDTSTGSSDD
jgi:hypothetical protein